MKVIMNICKSLHANCWRRTPGIENMIPDLSVATLTEYSAVRIIGHDRVHGFNFVGPTSLIEGPKEVLNKIYTFECLIETACVICVVER